MEGDFMRGTDRLPSGNAGLPDLSYYDFALAFLPLPLFVGLLVGKLPSVSPETGLLAGAVLSAMIVGHLLFGDPPTRRGPRGSGGGIEGSSA
jgi:hypothetical protein